MSIVATASPKSNPAPRYATLATLFAIASPNTLAALLIDLDNSTTDHQTGLREERELQKLAIDKLVEMVGVEESFKLTNSIHDLLYVK